METTTSFENSDNGIMPSNNMTLAIIATVVGLCSPCCIGLILGIVAIVMATQVKTKYESGDMAGANSSAKNAKILAYIAIGLFILNLIYFLGFGGMAAYEQILEQYNIAQ
ncbi:MAG: CD225/dispanin family protein [Flavobacteriaceae bacterium]